MAYVAVALAAGLLALGTLLPFLPGRYDPFAVPISAGATALAFGGLLLVPIGVAWLALGRPHAMARAALAVVTLVVAVAATLTAAVGSIAGAALLLAGWLVCLVRGWRRVGTARAAGVALSHAVPIALIVVPTVSVAVRLTLVGVASTWSREHAIASAAPILADIERFRARTGAYPPALNSLASDYDPGVVGIERYGYEPSGESFNLYFEAVPTDFATEEIVMYNPRGEADFSSHDADLLQLAPDDIRRQRGYFASHDLPQRGWKRFFFD
jgi:hypothetical protein